MMMMMSGLRWQLGVAAGLVAAASAQPALAQDRPMYELPPINPNRERPPITARKLPPIEVLESELPPITASELPPIEVLGSIAVPASDLANLQVVGVVYRLSARVLLRPDGDVDILSGVVWVPVPRRSTSMTPMVPVRRHLNIYHHTAGLEVKLFASAPWHLDANLGAGASTLDFDDFAVAGTPIDFTETYFTATGGPKLGYRRDRRTTHCHPERG